MGSRSLYPDSAADIKQLLDLDPDQPWKGPRKKVEGTP